jgi:hypothetical protein
MDFLTSYQEWLDVQNGLPNPVPPPEMMFDETFRFPRNVRDLGHIARSDTIYSVYFRAALILGDIGDDSRVNPYRNSIRQNGFATFGNADMLRLLGGVHQAERGTWYQKWNVHRYLRPEAGGGRVHVHNQEISGRDYGLHESLKVSSPIASSVLTRIRDLNKRLNSMRIGVAEDTLLLPQMSRGGSPSHPSFPAGHAVSAGACVTLLKAWFDTTRPFPSPVVPSADGTELVPYSGPTLTIGGELNKLAHNLSLGRDMSGVHWRSDDLAGLLQGEEIAIRILQNEIRTYPEPNAKFTLERFDGMDVEIKRDP